MQHRIQRRGGCVRVDFYVHIFGRAGINSCLTDDGTGRAITVGVDDHPSGLFSSDAGDGHGVVIAKLLVGNGQYSSNALCLRLRLARDGKPIRDVAQELSRDPTGGTGFGVNKDPLPGFVRETGETYDTTSR